MSSSLARTRNGSGRPPAKRSKRGRHLSWRITPSPPPGGHRGHRSRRRWTPPRVTAVAILACETLPIDTCNCSHRHRSWSNVELRRAALPAPLGGCYKYNGAACPRPREVLLIYMLTVKCMRTCIDNGCDVVPGTGSLGRCRAGNMAVLYRKRQV